MNYRLVNVILVVIGFGLAVWAYTQLPDQVASHWNSSGEADGTMSKFWGAFMFPLIMFGVYVLYRVIPNITLRKNGLQSFIKAYDIFFASMLGFMLYMYGITLWWNIIGPFNFNRALAFGFAILIWQAGYLIGHAKPNWFVGIRTPWTLESDEVWEDTHKLGETLFKIAGFIALLGVFWPTLAIWFLLVPVIIAAFAPIMYSYFRYQELTDSTRKH